MTAVNTTLHQGARAVSVRGVAIAPLGLPGGLHVPANAKALIVFAHRFERHLVVHSGRG